MTEPRQGVRTLTFRGALHEADRAVLRDRLGAVFCDESTPRPGWGWLAPDRRVTVSAVDGSEGLWRMSIWEVEDMGTEDSWVDGQVVEAFAKTSLEVVEGPSASAGT